MKKDSTTTSAYTQEILDNQGNVTQSGDIFDFKNATNCQLTKSSYYTLPIESIVLKYKNNKLSNVDEIFVKLLKLNSHAYNFDIKIVQDYVICKDEFGDDVYLDNTDNISLMLTKKLIINLKQSHEWNEKTINHFISGIYDFESILESIDYQDLEEKMENQLECLSALNVFLTKEKLKHNKMPNIDDKKLIHGFFIENNDKLDFIKIFGYEFKYHQISEFGFLHVYQSHGYNVEDLNLVLYNVKNYNVNILRLFLESNDFNGWNWNLVNLKTWLKDIPSNLIIDGIENIDEIFNFAYEGYFEDEDENLWRDLEFFYHDTRCEYRITVEEDTKRISFIMGSLSN
jgi:hypothetical protein